LVKVPNTREVKKPRLSLTDRGLLDLQHVVEGARQGGVVGLLATDDFHQRHLVHRAEEVQADEFLRLRRRLGRPVIGRVEVLEAITASGSAALAAALTLALSARSSNTASMIRSQAREVGVAGAGLDPGEQRIALFGSSGHGDLLVEQPGRVGLALLRGVQETSLSTTSMPAPPTQAMPAPIMPAPSTPTFFVA
jgi:hypothetical protein